ncbi:exosporium glycoprotein BclB-related protein [Peribacillus sp. ACCC06369]|uniref:exosporium glycoprotein BclB-related protein n=1 Tax=Peribacillus sp. ACCC06369 TaxID=3055860 RepID=UPI0025A1C8A6|nr:exosporium glycoprotein BclB-related protein [Peribacillus sp. ACCC06369]MDM5356503.1 exosporium glycoprotein BclB-related protein [Peribacillus sp. ACCC06369]
MIPFASGVVPIELTSVLGLAETGGLIGFGSSVSGVTIAGGLITIAVGDFAFVVPRAGTIESISAFFSATVGVILSEDVTVRAQLWRSTTAGVPDPNSSTFTPIPGAFVDLAPDFTPLVALGDNASNTNNLISIPVSAGDKLLMVFSLEDSGILVLLDSLTGFASAGIAIS